MRRVDYDDRLHQVYARGRALSPAAMAAWVAAFRRHLPERRPLTVLDLGSGTGRFTPALAEAFGGPVVGVEPSVRMREVAARDASYDRVTYIAGRAEAVPLAESACDAAVLFLVWHHVEDRAAAARELARVVRPGGRLVVRSNFSDRMPSLWWYRHFPRAAEVDATVHQPLARVLATFASAGWSVVELEAIEVDTGMTEREDLERLRLRALSTFEHLTEAEIDEGFTSIEQGSLAGGTEPVRVKGDLLVLARGQDPGQPQNRPDSSARGEA